MSATNAVVEGKMAPVQPAPITQQLLVTGQYLYDQLVVAGEEQKTRMMIIRDLIEKGADPLQIKGATDTMVDIAKQKDIDAGVDEKSRGPKRATAMNVRTIFQNIYGALKFAPEIAEIVGFTDDTGWIEGAILAKKTLTEAGKVWSGHDVPTKAAKEHAALARQRKGETEAMLQATKENPRLQNESLLGWNARIAQAAEAMVLKAQQDGIKEQAQKLFDYATKKYDRAVIGAAMVLFHEFFQSENNGASEVSEEEANAMLAQAAADGTVEMTENEEQHA